MTQFFPALIVHSSSRSAHRRTRQRGDPELTSNRLLQKLLCSRNANCVTLRKRAVRGKEVRKSAPKQVRCFALHSRIFVPQLMYKSTQNGVRGGEAALDRLVSVEAVQKL